MGRTPATHKEGVGFDSLRPLRLMARGLRDYVQRRAPEQQQGSPDNFQTQATALSRPLSVTGLNAGSVCAAVLLGHGGILLFGASDREESKVSEARGL